MHYCSIALRFSSLYTMAVMFISLLLIWIKYNNEHPYYNESLNLIRSGTLFMMLCSCFISLIGLALNINSIIIPILGFVAVVGGFIGGIYLCNLFFNKKINEILTKLKEKNLLYMSLENQYANESSSENSEEEESHSSNQSDENENENENEKSTSSSEEEYESDSSEAKLTKNPVHFSKTTLNKINIKKDLFDSIEDISNINI